MLLEPVGGLYSQVGDEADHTGGRGDEGLLLGFLFKQEFGPFLRFRGFQAVRAF